MNMFTANKRYTEKEILAQIFYPYGSDIIYTLDELNILRIWTGMAGLHLVLKSSVSSDNRQFLEASQSDFLSKEL